jgi:hypothetical protein
MMMMMMMMMILTTANVVPISKGFRPHVLMRTDLGD